MTGAEIRQSFLDFFREKAARDRAVVIAFAGLAQSAFHERRHEPVRARFFSASKSRHGIRRAWPTRRNAFAPAANITTSKTSVSTPIITRSSRCWAIGASVIISRRKRSSGRGNWWLTAGNFPPQRLYATVYKPGRRRTGEFDQEAYDHWARLVSGGRISIRRFTSSIGNKKDNFWMMGDTGPCGPCSELHVDLTPDGDTRERW